MYDELVKRFRDAAKISDALAVLLPHSEGNATAKLYNEAADAIEELSATVSKMENTRWIPVTERLPEEEQPVQVTYLGFNDGQPRSDMIACLFCGNWCYWDGEPCIYGKCKVEITHWMPLPQPPKEET